MGWAARRGRADPLSRRLRQLRSEFAEVTGTPFEHFYCPFLFCDEDVPLCEAHIVNKAFANSSRRWTVQRKDVDNWYGAMFESAFLDLELRGRRLDEVLLDPKLSRRLKPHLTVEGSVAEHYIARGKVPDHHTATIFESDRGPVRVGLKIEPAKMHALADADWQITIEKDVRLPALVSLLKSAHLTLFELVGYHHALSPGGRFLGRVLGDFFLQNIGAPREQVLVNAGQHFRDLFHLVRPVVSSVGLQGTVTDRLLHVCKTGDEPPWALAIWIRTSSSMHTVLVPLLEHPEAERRFLEFINGDDEVITANLMKWHGDRWEVFKKPVQRLRWPKTGMLFP